MQNRIKNSVENRPRKKVAQESEKGQSDGYPMVTGCSSGGMRGVCGGGGEVNLPCRSLQEFALSQARVQDAAMVRRIQTLRAFRLAKIGGLEA